MQRESCGGFTAVYAKRIQWWIYCVLCKKNPVMDVLRSMQRESSGGFKQYSRDGGTILILGNLPKL